MPYPVISTIKDFVYWHYANVAMIHAALTVETVENSETTAAYNFSIRTAMYKGLKEGKKNIRSLFDDEKYKLNTKVCCYCGRDDKLTLDHLISRYAGGTDDGNNLVYACQSCNSSKGKKDLLEWYHANNSFPPLMVYRRYLKLWYYYLLEHDALELPITEINNYYGSFRIDLLPTQYPSLNEIKL